LELSSLLLNKLNQRLGTFKGKTRGLAGNKAQKTKYEVHNFSLCLGRPFHAKLRTPQVEKPSK
jgi:hypothetical protein